MLMFGRLLLAAALSFAVVPASAQTKPKVVATFSILGDLVAQVAGDGSTSPSWSAPIPTPTAISPSRPMRARWPWRRPW